MSSILRKCATTCRTTTINTVTLIPGELKLEEMVVGITQWVTPRPSQLSVTSNMDSTCSAHQHSNIKGPITSEVVGDKNFKFICSFLCSCLFCFIHKHRSVTSQSFRPSFSFFGNFDDINIHIFNLFAKILRTRKKIEACVECG